LYTNASFRIRINNSISGVIPFKSDVRQGCSLSGGLFVMCLEPLLINIRHNPRIPGVLPPGGQFPSIVKTMIFWCSDWLDPPLFESRVNQNCFLFLVFPWIPREKFHHQN